MILFRGRGLKTEARIFTGSMADIIFLLIIFFVITYKVEVDKTQLDLPDTTVRVTIPESEKPAWISIASRREGYLIRVSTGEEMSLPIGTDEELVTFASTMRPSEFRIGPGSSHAEYAYVRLPRYDISHDQRVSRFSGRK